MKKFLSLILALTLVASLFTVNVMAASKAHTVTITADKTTELAAGDTVTIELAIDNTEALTSCAYVLNFDNTAFTADTTKVSRLEKCIDKAWLDGIKDTDGDWGYYLGAPTYKVNANNFNFQWAGAEGVEAEYAMDNRVIGKFYLTVNDGVADGEYTFYLTGAKTLDAGETLPTEIISEALTVKVGADAPANPTVGGTTADATNGVASVDGTKIYDNAMAVSAEITPVATTTEIGVLFAPKAWLGDKALEATLDGVAKAAKTGIVGGVLTTLKAAIKDIPRALNDTEFVMVTRAYAYDNATYTYADAAETTMLFTKTAE